MKHFDVIIIGGGPAGTACAWRLRQHGVRCLILDQHDFPRPKVCAGWITPEVIRLLDFQEEDYPHSFTTFTRFLISIKGFRTRLCTRQHAIRRVEFDEWMLRRAQADFQVHKVFKIVHNTKGYEIDGLFSAKYLVGAGGTYCPVFRAFFKDQAERKKEALIVAQEEEFYYPTTDGECRLWFFENQLPGYAWYVPKENGFINVGVGAKAVRLKLNGDTLKNHWNLLTDKLSGAGLIQGHQYKPVAHSYYLRGSSVKLRTGNAFLVGDSAGLSTLDMGEGIGAALQSGLLAAESIAKGTNYSVESIPRYSFISIIRSGLLRT